MARKRRSGEPALQVPSGEIDEMPLRVRGPCLRRCWAISGGLARTMEQQAGGQDRRDDPSHGLSLDFTPAPRLPTCSGSIPCASAYASACTVMSARVEAHDIPPIACALGEYPRTSDIWTSGHAFRVSDRIRLYPQPNYAGWLAGVECRLSPRKRACALCENRLNWCWDARSLGLRDRLCTPLPARRAPPSPTGSRRA